MDWHGTERAPEVVFTAEEALAMDRWLAEERGRPVEQLMAVAGARLAAAVRDRLAAGAGPRVVALVGPGNNGGDALVARDELAPDVDVEVWRPLAGDPTPALDGHTLVVDGLFGVGLVRPVTGAAGQALAAVAASEARVLAVDVPSGLDATSGRVLRGDHGEGTALPADWTLTFVGPKAGFFVADGPAHVGRWCAVDIGFPVDEVRDWVAARRAAAD